MLFSPKRRRQPGPKGPNRELIQAVVELKRRNPNWGCPRIAQQITLAFGVEIDKDVVRRILCVHYRPESNSGGPSWLTFLGHTKDSLWSCDCRVSASRNRPNGAARAQHRQRSLVSIPSVAGQPPSAGGDGNQNGALRAFIPGRVEEWRHAS
jgi:hypothetical protein